MKKKFEEEKVKVDKFAEDRKKAEAEHREVRSEENLIGTLLPIDTTLSIPTRITAGEPVKLGVSASTPLGPATLERYFWKFGNGQSSREPSPETTYGAPGSYLVTVTVMDYTGAVGSASRYLEVQPSAGQAAVQHKFSVETTAEDGITTYSFSTEDRKEKILVTTTDDLALGDPMVVGHVTGTAKAANQDELAKNETEVTGTVVDLGDGRTPVADKVLRTSIPLGVGGGALYLILRDATGKETGKVPVPVSPAPGPQPTIPTPSDYTLPKLGIAGRPVVTRGVFSRYSRVAIGDEEGEILAMSPRTLAVKGPTDITGPTTIKVQEGDVEKSGQFRMLDVSMEIDSSELATHQGTTAHVTVRGLQDLQEPIALRLVNYTPAVVRLQGGDEQTLRLGPGGEPVQPGGVVVVSRRVRAVQKGEFRIDVLLPKPQ